VGIGTPPLGIVYYTSTVGQANDRNGVTAHHVGGTVVQSLGDRGLAVGSTLTLVHAAGENRFDADLGVMLAGSLGRIGLTVHHLTEPDFGESLGRLERRVRAGVAILARQDTTVAADVEFTTTSAPQGAWRDAAVGVETHPQARAWLRTGAHWNTAGGTAGAAPVMSVGGSYAIYGSVLVDAQGSFGSSAGDRGWGVGLRFNF
jgi:hypothetical protein